MREWLMIVFMVVIGLIAPAVLAADEGAASQPGARMTALYIAGDSTVKSSGIVMGWGDPIQGFFDAKRLHMENHAIGGRSSRVYVDEGRWEVIRKKLKAGDFVLMQFGHNDSKGQMSMDRYSLPGLGDESEEGTNPKTNEKVTIHTFGYYMKKMVREGQEAGATVIVLTPVPRNKWENGKIVRGEQGTGGWAKEVAEQLKAQFIDLNGVIADRYDPVGQTAIKALYFPQDNTHTNPVGAKLNAACVVLGLLDLKDCRLKDYLLPDAKAIAEKAATIDVSAAATAIAPAK
jgi:lysophospholipase L1-like esterase